MLGVKPREMLMVATHADDLVAARKAGLRTAFVWRPREHGPRKADVAPQIPAFDFTAQDFVDLAVKLGA